MGQVCAKHNQYYEKECPWCEAPEVLPESVIISADEFNAHIAEAAAIGKAQREQVEGPLMLRWPKDKAT